MTRKWIGPVMIVAMLLFTLFTYSSLPDPMPSHWNARGEVDGWSSRFWGSLLSPLVAAVIWLLLPVLRRVDPRRRNYDRFDPTFWLLINLLMLFFAGVHVATLGVALGWNVAIPQVMMGMLGLMMVGLGNYMPRLRSNWWMGIRTPWTLESESVWRATHRLAGYTFVIAGVVTLGAMLLPPMAAVTVTMTAILIGVFTPAVYSYFAYRRERRDAAVQGSAGRTP